MTQWYFVSYADGEKYVSYQSRLSDLLSGHMTCMSFSKSNLVTSKFYQTHRKILDQKRGAGYWLWKPYFILSALKKMPENSFLLYLDVGDSIKNTEEFKNFCKQSLIDKSIMVVPGVFPQYQYTKGDCFSLMRCDEEKYYFVNQLEAGILVVKNTEFSRNFIEKWLLACTDERVLTDITNIKRENLSGFIDHRHDQSVLTNLVYKKLFFWKKNDSHEQIMIDNRIRNYIECNVYD